MAESNFVDYVKIYCRSGKGGRGSTHMRREKYCPNGGPDGGDGGRGGHIILRGNRNYWTLLHLKYDRHAMAGHGESGSKGRSFGKDGADKIIEVPCGTVVYNAETGEYLCDVTEDGQEVMSDKVHTENVKCFRNIQDLFKVMGDKVDTVSELEKQVGTTKTFAVISTVLAIINTFGFVAIALYILGFFGSIF